MNEMAMVEYLLGLYASFSRKLNASIGWRNISSADYFRGRRDQIKEIINERFGMTIRETGTEYIAESSVCSVSVRK